MSAGSCTVPVKLPFTTPPLPRLQLRRVTKASERPHCEMKGKMKARRACTDHRQRLRLVKLFLIVAEWHSCCVLPHKAEIISTSFKPSCRYSTATECCLPFNRVNLEEWGGGVPQGRTLGSLSLFKGSTAAAAAVK